MCKGAIIHLQFLSTGITVLPGGTQVIRTNTLNGGPAANSASAPKVQKLIKIGNRFIPRSHIVNVRKALTKDNTVVYVAVSAADKS